MVKNTSANADASGDTGLIPGLRISPGGEKSNTLQYSYLENPMDRRTWWATGHGVAKSPIRLSNHTHTNTKMSVFKNKTKQNKTKACNKLKSALQESG